ncbi:hypothetical protein RND81_13G007900 [Saponaria officinalis]|uniref:CobW/HypB/UreG nucleotide-binding domain-containing protein n=1 Tax=Saponaria officinalis TaxID=3572 RepID=A0AAW1GSH5_SAPOF
MTTLLNHILTAQHGRRIAVVKIEFKVVDIDGSLVTSHSSSNEDIVMVNNGCLFCTARGGDWGNMLRKLSWEERSKFDYIIIETTGLFSSFDAFYALSGHCFENIKLDGFVHLVDSKHAMNECVEQNTREDRIYTREDCIREDRIRADRIILNKIDLVTEAELQELTQKIRE